MTGSTTTVSPRVRTRTWPVPVSLVVLSVIPLVAGVLCLGTQVLTEGLGPPLFGTGELRGDLFKLAGWVINLAVAERVIRGARPPRSGLR